MNSSIKLLTAIAGFMLLIFVANPADSSTCYTATNNLGSSIFDLYQTTSSGLVLSNFPENAKVNRIDVKILYGKSAGTFLKFYLQKVNSTSNYWFLSNWGYDRGAQWSNYTSTINAIQFASNVGVNGEWRLSIYHDGTYQNPNPWGDYYADCYRCHTKAQLTSWSLTLCYDAVPAPPVLTSPANNYSSTWKPANLEWNASANATKYYVQVAKDAGFNTIVHEGENNDTFYPVFDDISDFGTYYWRVKAGNDAGEWSEYSATRSFTWYTTADMNPVPVSPPSSPPIWKHEAVLVWTPPSSGYIYQDGTGYHYINYFIDVATDSSFTHKIIDNADIFGINYMPIDNYVTENQTYYWRIRAKIDYLVYGPYGISSFTVNSRFFIQNFDSEFDRFNPYGGGVSTFAADLSSDPSGTSTWTISVAGRTYNGSGTPAYFTWDGKNDAGMLVNPGTYTATITATSADGSCTDTKQVSITVEKPVEPVSATCETSLEFCSGSSTNIGTGSVSHEQVLFTAKGPTSDLSFVLQYNSLDSLSGSLGASWTHNFDIALENGADGAKIFRQGFKRAIYTLSDTTYVAPANDFSSLVHNADGTYTISLRNGDKYHFDASGIITAIDSRYGRELDFLYFDAFNLKYAEIYDQSQRTIYFIKEGNLIRKFVDPNNKVYDISYTGTTNPRLNLVINPDPDNPGTNYWSYSYDGESSRMTTKRDPNGNVTTYSYYADGRMKDAIDPEGDPVKGLSAAGHTRSVLYDTANQQTGPRQTSFYEKNGAVWQNIYDPYQGVLKQIVSPGGGKITDYFYYSNGSLKAKSEPYGDGKQLTTFYRYDVYGNITDISEPIDFTTVAASYLPQGIDTLDINSFDNADSPIKWATRYTYDYANYDQIASAIDLRGSIPLTTTFQRSVESDTGLLLTQITAPGKISGETLVSYQRQNPDGTLASITDANGKTTSFGYYPFNGTAADGMLESITQPNSVKTLFTSYDAYGNATSLTRKDTTSTSVPVTTTKSYNTLNRLNTVLTSVATPPYTSLNYQYFYDMAGNLTTVIDPENRQTQYKHNYQGKTTDIIDDRNNKSQLLYSGSGCSSCGSGIDQLNTVQDANHVAKGVEGTVYRYDELGRLEFETDPLGNVLHYTYYDNGLLKTMADATEGGDSLLATYYYNTRGQITDKSFSDGTAEHYTYYPSGQLQTAGNQHITYTYTWYDNGWLKDVTDDQGRKITYDDYDPLGQRKQVTIMAGSADQHIISYDYDSANRPWHIYGTGTIAYDYDARGRKHSLAYLGLQTSTEYGYDDLDRLTTVTHSSGGSSFAVYGYPEYDGMGNRKSRTGSSPEGYGYDELYRLISRVVAGGTENFTYDAAGNRLTGPSPKDIGYQYDDANQMTMGRTFGHTYDNQGNQISRIVGGSADKSWTLTWDRQNRLTQMEKIKGAESQILTFKYDPMGRRIEKKFVLTRDGSIKTSTWTYVYDQRNIALEIYKDPNNMTTKTFYTHGPGIDEPLAMERRGQYDLYSHVYHFHADGLGSIAAITDSSRNVVQSYSYSAYGIPKATTGFRNSYQFAGREWDKESHLYFNRARYFDPYDGIFISRDPLSFAAGDYNLYRYVENNPINWFDPDGFTRQNISPVEQHPGGQKHVHWGDEPKCRNGGAVNEDGTYRHGTRPPNKIRDLIRKATGWALGNLDSLVPLVILPGQHQILDNFSNGMPLDYTLGTIY
ncbi:MAG: hypothetical protein CXR30_17610 [Geobacter sp.]|nr:MAG: hypothetical protein CXR30_17610 [Geobacter sp.]